MNVQLTLPMIAWASMVYTLQNTPKEVLNPEVGANVDELSLGPKSQLVTLVQDNSEKVGKFNKKTGQRYTIPLSKEVSTTVTQPQAGIILAVLQAYIRENETHQWWTVDAERHVNAVLQMHQMNVGQLIAVQ